MKRKAIPRLPVPAHEVVIATGAVYTLGYQLDQITDIARKLGMVRLCVDINLVPLPDTGEKP